MKIDYKELAAIYESEIEGWHLFYESFEEYNNAISVARGVLVSMSSELLKAKINNPNNPKLKDTKNRISVIFSAIDKLEGLNCRCMRLQTKLKSVTELQLKLESENKYLKSEIEAIKKAFNNE